MRTLRDRTDSSVMDIQSWVNRYLFQHTPVLQNVQVSLLLQVHDESSELVEELSLEGFGEDASSHLFHWTILDEKIFHIGTVAVMK